MQPRLRYWGIWLVVFSWAGAGTPGVPGPAPRVDVDAGQVAAAPPATAEETEIGRSAAQDMESRYGLCTDAAMNARVRRVAATVLRVCGSRTPISIRVLKSDEPNGVALPGGYIFITQGLTRLLKEDDILAAALGHEMAHIALGHMAEMLREQTRAHLPATPGQGAAREQPATSPEGQSPAAEAPRKPAESPVHAREKAADRAAVRYMRAAGIDPKAVVRLLVRLSQQPELDATASPTHPTWPDRIQGVEAYLSSLEPRRPEQRAGSFPSPYPAWPGVVGGQ